MAWHIFRKDLILLWPLAVLSLLVQIGLNALMFAADRAPELQYLLLAARLFVLVAFLVIALTIALGVHQESIPGTRQDWLVRPIRRLDLLGAKVLFVLAVVHLPMLLADVAEAIAHGFSLPQALMAALSRNLFMLATVSAPAFAFAAMTRNLAQFIGVGVVYFIAIVGVTFLLSSVARINGEEQATNPLFWTGVAWIPQTAGRLALSAGAGVAIALLYLGRRIVLARSIVPVFAALSALAAFLPWGWIYSVQQVASPALPEVSLAFDPQAPRYRPGPGESPDDYTPGAAQVELRGRSAGDIAVENKSRHSDGDVSVFIPVRISGLPADTLPWADRAVIVLKDENDRVVFRGRGDDLKLGDREPGATRTYETIRIPALVYEAARDQPLTIDIDYSMSLLQAHPSVTAPALGASVQLPGVGRCTTGRDRDGDEIELRCLQAGRAPSCVSVTLEDVSTGQRNPETRICAPDYSPYAGKPFPDEIARFEVEAPFRDRLGLASYPVGGAQLDRSRVVLTLYEPSAHLARHVTATDVYLSAWLIDAGSSG
jgi:hypothetical protein